MKEKSTERENDIKGKSTLKSTHNMLNGQSFNGGKNINSSKVEIAELFSQKQNKTPINGPHKQPVSEAKVLSEMGCSKKMTFVTGDNKSDARASDIGVSSTAGVIPRKQFFQMRALENLWEQDEKNSDSGVEYPYKKSELTIAELHHFLGELAVPKHQRI